MCCTFNMAKANEIFHESEYSQMVEKMQNRDLDQSFGDQKPPNWYTEQNEPQSKVGKSKGLTLILDGHTNLLGTFHRIPIKNGI